MSAVTPLISQWVARFFSSLFIGLAAMIAYLSIAQADVTARLDQPQVVLGDVFTLEISADGNDAGTMPDLTPLEKDFEVLGTGQSIQTRIINGTASVSRSWSIQLQPRDVGTLTIPAITVGAGKSQPLQVKVLDPASVPRGNLSTTGVEISVDVPDGPFYVQQEIPVTVRILDGAGLRQARLTPLDPENAVVTQVGEDQITSGTINGRSVTQIERKYMVKPQQSGELKLPVLTLRGRVPDPNARRNGPFGRDPFAEMRDRFGLPDIGGGLFEDMMNPGREITVRSDPVTLDIQPRPAGSDGWFLPAKNVELRASWDPATPDFAVGEAATRVIQIVALGASQDALPELEFTDAPGARIYVDRSDARETETPDGTAAIRQYTISVVPTKGGDVVLPEIALDWFDTNSQTTRTAVLPSETIKVAGTAASPAPAQPNSANSETGNTNPSSGSTAQSPDRIGPSAWVYVLAVLGGLLGLGLFWVAYNRWLSGRKVQREQKPQDAHGKGKAELDQIARNLRAACQRNDAHEAYRHVLAWLNAGGRTQMEGDSATANDLRAQIALLEAAIYATSTSDAWRGKDLLRAFDAFVQNRLTEATRRARKPALPGLYPDTKSLSGSM